MNDPHAPSASSAHNAFNAAFPTEEKQMEVFEFSFKSIVTVSSFSINLAVCTTQCGKFIFKAFGWSLSGPLKSGPEIRPPL